MQLVLRGLVGAVVISAVWAVMSVHAASAEAGTEAKPAGKEITCTVVKACPKGCFIKVKTEDDKVLGFLPVAGKTNKETVKALKTGEKVVLTIVQCPKSGKDTVSKVAKVEADTK